MFGNFHGEIIGTPVFDSGASCEQMFRETSTGVNMNEWDLSPATNTQNMFYEATGSVNVDNTIIGTSDNMFYSFNGTLSGTPTFAEGKSHKYMFYQCTVNFDFRSRELTAAMDFTKMFEGATGSVKLYEDQYALIDADGGWHGSEDLEKNQEQRPVSTDEEEDDDTGLIVGLAVGGAAILVVVGIIVKHSMKSTSGYILL